MRIAIISDTHMPRGDAGAAGRAASRELRAADAILHAGDFMRVEVLRMLEALGPPVHGDPRQRRRRRAAAHAAGGARGRGRRARGSR